MFLSLKKLRLHVNFTQLIGVASEYGCALLGYGSQADFLIDAD
jgi:SAM-dependent MidA family methyltransferase